MKLRRNKIRTSGSGPRQQELQPIDYSVPDVSSPAFAAQAHRESLAIARSPYEKADQDFVDAISDWDGE